MTELEALNIVIAGYRARISRHKRFGRDKNVIKDTEVLNKLLDVKRYFENGKQKDW